MGINVSLLTGSSLTTRHKSPSLLRVPNPFKEDPTKKSLLPRETERMIRYYIKFKIAMYIHKGHAKQGNIRGNNS